VAHGDLVFVVFFFFQAEDGIRDRNVTGVQTCALPILENFVTTLGGYIANLIPMSLTLTPFSESEWLGKNTIFFWAWHISWAPFRSEERRVGKECRCWGGREE